MSGNKGKNPWGNNSNDDGGNPWGAGSGSGGSGGGGQEPPDMEEMLRRAQDNLNGVIPGGFGGGKAIGLGLLVIIGLWLISGFYVVNPGEHAVIQRFGAWDRTQAEPGLGYHLPIPIESASIFNVEEIRKMNIGFQEAFSRSSHNGAGVVRDIPEESLMLTSDRNIVNLHLELQWNIKSSEDFVFEIRDQENTIKKVAESAIREVVGQTNMFPIITNKRQEVADKTKEIIQKNLDEYQSGVNITSVLIQRAELHPDVQGAFQDVQSAKQDAEDVQNRAEAYREDILPRARGQAIKMSEEAQAYKESVIARAKGDADRFNAVYKAYLTGKDVTKERIYLETLENVLSNAQKIILSEGGSGVVPYLPLDQIARGGASARQDTLSER